jgi:hypothetical protein
MSLLEEIRSTLEAAGIRHALIGALALATYGVMALAGGRDLQRPLPYRQLPAGPWSRDPRS